MLRNSILALAAALALLAGCTGSGIYKYDAQGAPYEIVVVADHNVWDGPAGDTLRATFYRQFPMVNRQETTFDVLRVLPSGFKKLVTRHRNVLIALVDETLTAPALTVSRDM